MSFSSFSAGWRGGLAGLLVVLAAGCQSERAAFRFAPAAPRRETAAATATPTAAPDAAAATSATSPARVAPQPQAETPLARQAENGPPRAVRRRNRAPELRAQPAGEPTWARGAAPAERRLWRRAARRPAAESGLGTTVIGVLGIPVLAVGLVGLAFGGGLVFGLLAGAGALALLVAYLDPFG